MTTQSHRLLATAASVAPLLAALTPLAHATQSTKHAPRGAALDASQTHFALAAQNLGVAGRFLPSASGVDGFGILVLVEETDADLNGDGDPFDQVVHLLPEGSTSLVNIGLAVGDGVPARLVGQHALIVVSEHDQGADLNGDSDTLDDVLHLHDVVTGATTNLGLARGGPFWLAPGSGLVLIDETAQNATDLNADGDSLDQVYHHVDAKSGAVQNLGLAAGGSFFDPGDGQLWALRVSETAQGSDLDGDGLVIGTVPFLYAPPSGSLTNLGPAGLEFIAASDGRAALARSEAIFGADLNQDGDLADLVAEIVEPASGTTIRTGLSVFLPQGAAQVGTGSMAGRYLVLPVSERGQALDLNGDGDTWDLVTHLVDVRVGTILSTGVAGLSAQGFEGDRIVQFVSEASQGGQDLNGDGDALDQVLSVFDPSTGISTVLGISATTPYELRGDLVAFSVREKLEGDADLNGDGDSNDHVWHTFETDTATLSNLRLGTSGLFTVMAVGDGFVAAAGSENITGATDLNGDGDALDNVLFVFECASGALTNLGLVVETPPIALGKRLVFSVNEASQAGTDLNGDGDTDDEVLHVLDLP